MVSPVLGLGALEQCESRFWIVTEAGDVPSEKAEITSRNQRSRRRRRAEASTVLNASAVDSSDGGYPPPPEEGSFRIQRQW